MLQLDVFLLWIITIIIYFDNLSSVIQPISKRCVCEDGGLDTVSNDNAIYVLHSPLPRVLDKRVVIYIPTHISPCCVPLRVGGDRQKHPCINHVGTLFSAFFPLIVRFPLNLLIGCWYPRQDSAICICFQVLECIQNLRRHISSVFLSHGLVLRLINDYCQ